MLPGSQKKLLANEAGSLHPLNSVPQAKKILDLGFWFSKKIVRATLGFPLETGVGRGRTLGNEGAGSLQPLNGPGKRGRKLRFFLCLRPGGSKAYA